MNGTSRAAMVRDGANAPPHHEDQTISMQSEHAVDGAQFSRLDQLGMGHRDRIQRTFQLFLPEAEKILQRREFR
jgi:hypothetical protein